MSSKRISEKDLLKNLDAHTAHADELATPSAQELDPLERLRASVLRYEGPLDPVWDEYVDGDAELDDAVNQREQSGGPQ